MNKIENMTVENAKMISTWKYPDEYSMYSFSTNEETISELMNGDFFSCKNSEGKLIGYFCYGFSAQIPSEVNYLVDDRIDIGLGLSPELCGHGYGKEFMQIGIDYAKKKFNKNKMRLVVAEFNTRAITLYKNCGFKPIKIVKHKNINMNFIVMQRELSI